MQLVYAMHDGQSLMHPLVGLNDDNPIIITGPLTPFVIGSYHEIYTCLANYNKCLKLTLTNLYS